MKLFKILLLPIIALSIKENNCQSMENIQDTDYICTDNKTLEQNILNLIDYNNESNYENTIKKQVLFLRILN